MNAILKGFPSAIGKAGKELATKHRDKIARVVDCGTATDKELRDPKKFKEWLGVSTKAKKFSVSKDIPTNNEIIKKLNISVTIFDYEKIGKSIDDANKFLVKARKWDPARNVQDRLAFAYVFYDQFKKDRKAKKPREKLIMNAGWTAEELLSLTWDLNAARAHVVAWQKKAPVLYKGYGMYHQTFLNTENALEKASLLMDGHLELSEVRSTVFAHWQAVASLTSKCKDAKANARELGDRMAKLKPKIDIGLNEANAILADVSEYAAPALVRKVEKEIKRTIAPYSEVLEKMFGLK